MPLMTCRDLCLGYDGHTLVKDLNFTVNAGDYLCIVGENGAGKSTLMRTLLGLQEPVSGSITLGDGTAPAGSRLAAAADARAAGLPRRRGRGGALRLSGAGGLSPLLYQGGQGPRARRHGAHGHSAA